MLQVPVLHHFPFVLMASTLVSLLVSFGIAKAGGLRYFFGLPPPEDSYLPGKALKGLIPGLVLVVIIVIEVILANSLSSRFPNSQVLISG